MAINNPLIPGDPYSYDLKWIVAKVKEILAQLGTLDEAIEAKIFEGFLEHSVVQFKTVEEMLAADIVDGSIVLTLGYHEAGDLGSMFYLVQDFNPAQCSLDYFLTMDNNRQIAIPVVTTPYVTPEMFGAYGDGVHDDTEAFTVALTVSDNVQATKNYMVSSTGDPAITLEDGQSLKGGGTISMAPNDLSIYTIVYMAGKNSVLQDITLIGDKDGHTGSSGEWGHNISIDGENVTVENVNSFKAWGDGVYLRGCSNVMIRNSRFNENRRNGISVTSGSAIVVRDCYFNDNSGTAPESGISVEANEISDVIEAKFIDCVCNGNGGTGGFYATLRASNSNVVFKNVKTDKGYGTAFLSGENSRVEIIGCSWKEQSSRGVYNLDLLNANNSVLYQDNEIDAGNAVTVLRSTGVGVYNFTIKDDVVKNGSFGRPALWLGTPAGTNKHVELKLKNCTFTEPQYGFYRTSDATTEYLKIENDEIREITAPIGDDYVHDKFVIPATASIAANTRIAGFNIYNGTEIVIRNMTANKYQIASNQLYYSVLGNSQLANIAGYSVNELHGRPGDYISLILLPPPA